MQIRLQDVIVLVTAIVLEMPADIGACDIDQNVDVASLIGRLPDRIGTRHIHGDCAAAQLRGEFFELAFRARARITSAPASRMPRAIARPMPRLAPAISAVLPCSEKGFKRLLSQASGLLQLKLTL